MYYFGKRVKKPLGLPAPDVAGTTEFGRYLQYGRTSFGRRYFGARRSLFGKRVRRIKSAPVEPAESEMSAFGRTRRTRRYRRTRKVKKPSKALVKMCRRYSIKVTRKVGKKKVYKSLTVLKLQLKHKKTLKRRSKFDLRRRGRSTRRRSTRRRSTRRRSTRRRRVSLFGIKF